MQRRQNPCSDRSESSLARTSANTLQTSESFVRTAEKTCMRKDVRYRETCLLHSARASRHRREDSERLIQRRVPLDESLGKMAWIHALGHDAPVSSPQGYVEGALSSVGHSVASGGHEARPSRMLPRSLRILNGCHFCCRRLKIRPVWTHAMGSLCRPVGAGPAPTLP